MRFRDKVVWITGATSGIGEALAHAFWKEGARLILSARREGELARVKQELGGDERIALVPLDLANSSAIPQQAELALRAFGHVDILVNNAGISQRALARDTKFEVDRQIIETNLLGTICLTKAVLPHMLARKSGHIVTVTSVVGHIGTPLRSGYAASKHGLHGFFESLRAEVWRNGIVITMVAPGFVRTNISINAFTGTGEKQNRMDSATERGLSPQECARRIVNAVYARKEDVVVAGKEGYAILLKRFFPSLFRSVLRSAKVT